MTRVKIKVGDKAFAVVQRDCPESTIKLLQRMVMYVKQNPQHFTETKPKPK